MCTNRVEEVTVVAHHKNGILIIGKVFFKPGHGFHIEVVGRFVKEQVVRITEQSLCQHDTYLFLTAQFTHELVVQVFLDTEAAQQSSCIAFGIPTIELCKLFFEFRHTDTVFIGKIRLCIKSIAFVHDIPKDGMTHQHGIEYRILIPLEVVLAKYRKAFARTKGYRSFGRLQFARNGFQEGRLTGTVGTDDTIDITIRELQVHILVQHTLAKLDGEIGNCYHVFLSLSLVIIY